MARVPSTRWTVADVLSAAREMAQDVGVDKVVQEQGKYFYKLALSEVVTLLNSSSDPAYFTSTPLTVTSGVADIASVLYDRIISISDSKFGGTNEISPQEFDSITRADFPHASYDDDIVWTQIGNSIRFRSGANIKNEGTKTLWYQRQPNYPTLYDDSEFVDVADKWVPLLVKRIYTQMTLQEKHDVPTNLAEDMKMDYEQIMAFVAAETGVRTKQGKQAEEKK